jgi:molybdopterin/thiamine biosynthesis adenylyltransferase
MTPTPFSPDAGISAFTHEHRRKLAASKVVVAGVGGVGGIEAAVLAGLGVGEMTIFDPGIFDEPDMNRQFGATVSTLGENKAVATARQLRKINPAMRFTVLDHAPPTAETLDEIMAGAHVAIDAIDYMGFDYKALFAQCVRRAGLYNFTAPISGLATAIFILDPDGITLEELYDAPADESLWPAHKLPLDRLLGPKLYGPLVADMMEGRRTYLSNCAGIATFNGGLVALEIALLLTGLRSPEELVCAPEAVYADLLTRECGSYNLMEAKQS